MRAILGALIVTVSTSAWAVTCDSDAPLPTSARELRAERGELQRRLAMIDERLARLGNASPPRSAAPPSSAAFAGSSSAAAPQRALPPGCFVGPRGGTYTITKSGKKNYGGC